MKTTEPTPPEPKSGELLFELRTLQKILEPSPISGGANICASAINELTHFQARVAELEEELDEYKYQYDDCDSMVANLKARVAELEAEVDRLRDDLKAIP